MCFISNSARDALAIREAAAAEKNVVVIGSGFNALEAAAALTEAKCKVILMTRQLTLWREHLDSETSQWLSDYFEKHGVKFDARAGPEWFRGQDHAQECADENAGTGLPRRWLWWRSAPIPTSSSCTTRRSAAPNGTPVNELLETDEKGIFAAGDIALFPDRIFGGVVKRIQHWTNAKRAGPHCRAKYDRQKARPV